MDFLILLFFVNNMLFTFVFWPGIGATYLCNDANDYYSIDGKICGDACPWKFINDFDPIKGHLCNLPNSDAGIFELEFWKVQNLNQSFITSSINSNDNWGNPDFSPCNSITKKPPFPTRSRGFYFTSASSIISNQNYIPSLYFTIALWILGLDAGRILTVSADLNEYIVLSFDPNGDSSFKIKAKISDPNGTQPFMDFLLDSSWQYVQIQINQADSNTVELILIINNYSDDTVVTSFDRTYNCNYQASFPNKIYQWKIGKATETSFSGFLYWIKGWNVFQDGYFVLNLANLCNNVSYNNLCLTCGSHNNPNSCDPPTSTCSPGYVDDCTSCYSPQCPECYGYSENMCETCTNGKKPTCCDWLASSCSSTWNSTTCSSGAILINQVCLYAIPYGFVNNLPVNTPVINADFTKSFAGIYDSILVTGESSSTYNFWNSPESIDPLPAKQRGLYFIPNSYLKATINLYHTFTIGAWVYPISGSYITYTGNQLNVNSSGTIEICMPNFVGISKTYSTSISTNLQKWNYISYSIEYLYNGTSSISPYIDTDIWNPYFVQEGIFRPTAGGSLYLGSTNFNGFISLFQLWQIAISNFQSYRSYFSGSAGLKLWSCDFDSFYDGSSCQKCLDSCQTGCVRANSCNICDSELCLQCSSFEPKSCSLCVDNRLGSSCSFCTDFLCDACNTSSNGCKSCKANASVQDNYCVCNNGYNGTTACKYVPFLVNLLIFSNDSLSLDFSDPLQYTLVNSSFKISIENNPEFTWSLEQLNNTYYNIQTKINEKIEKNTIINVTFFDLTKVKSIYNGILNSSTISSKLNEYDPASYSLAMTAITSQIVAVVQGAVIGCIAVSFVNPNPSSLWGLLGCLQILSYLSLSGIPFSEKMNEFLSNLNSYSLFPNIFEFLIDEKKGNKAYKEAINFGYNTDLILLNQGDDFSIVAASLFFIPFVYYFADCSYRIVGKKFKNMFRNYKYNFYIRFWIQCSLELGAAAGVGLRMFEVHNFTQIANIIICFAVFSLFVASPFAFFWFTYSNRLKIQSKSKKFNSLFDSFFYEFRTEKGFIYSLYYFVYYLRRTIYSINLVFLSDYPRTQVAINIICSLLSIFYLLVYWPYKEKIIQISNLVSEIMIGIIMCATSSYLFDVSSSLISGLENFIIFTSIVVVGTQFSTSIAIFVRTLYQIFGDKLNRYGNAKLKVHPIEKIPKAI